MNRLDAGPKAAPLERRFSATGSASQRTALTFYAIALLPGT